MLVKRDESTGRYSRNVEAEIKLVEGIQARYSAAPYNGGLKQDDLPQLERLTWTLTGSSFPSVELAQPIALETLTPGEAACYGKTEAYRISLQLKKNASTDRGPIFTRAVKTLKALGAEFPTIPNGECRTCFTLDGVSVKLTLENSL